MSHSKPAVRLVLAAALSLAATPVLAHPGGAQAHSFLAGVQHPLFGWDHLLAMLAVGLWAGIAGGGARWAWPLAFLGGMALGGGLGLGGLGLPAGEPIVLASVLALGIAALLALRPPLALAAAAVVLLGVAHGNAHGLEAPADGGGLLYAAGFLAASAALHAGGLGAAVLARNSGAAWLARALGLAVALGGLALAAG